MTVGSTAEGSRTLGAWLARPSLSFRGLPLLLWGTLLYIAVSFYAFRDVLGANFESQGLVYREPAPGPYLLAIALTLAVALVMPRRIERVSDFAVLLLFVFAAAPCMLVPHYLAVLPALAALKVTFAVAACLVAAKLLIDAGPTDTTPRLQVSHTSFWLALTAYSLAIYLYMALSGRLSFEYVSLEAVYGVRAEYFGSTRVTSRSATSCRFRAMSSTPPSSRPVCSDDDGCR